MLCVYIHTHALYVYMYTLVIQILYIYIYIYITSIAVLADQFDAYLRYLILQLHEDYGTMILIIFGAPTVLGGWSGSATTYITGLIILLIVPFSCRGLT